MKRLIEVKYILAYFLIAVGLLFGQKMQVLAQDAAVTFGSESYSAQSDTEFQVGVYINGDAKIGTYYVEIEYDTDRMVYLSGGDSEQDGRIILQGTGLQEQVKYMLRFQAVGGGDAGIRISSASVQTAQESGGEDFEITVMGTAPIIISGTDETGISFFDRPEGEQESVEGDTYAPTFGIDTDIPILAAIDMGNGERYYLVDHAQYIPDAVQWAYRTVPGRYGGQQLTFLTNVTGTVTLLYLMDGEEHFYPFAYNSEKDMFYACFETVCDNETYLYMSPEACSEWPEELTMQAVAEDYVFYAMDLTGEGKFCQLDGAGNLTEWNPEQSKTSSSTQMKKLVYILAAAGIVLLLVCISACWAVVVKKRKTRQKYQKYRQLQKRLEEQEQKELQDGELGFEPLAVQEGYDLPELEELWDISVEENEEEPVISVQDVTMVFHISTSNASGIKEYLIQWLKRQVSFRELTALNHVSFDVFKGEVVGIIGTNGSGKSTLLRIVSGALNPTSGQVKVDHKKVQLLTLGTGFDTELSARENVYLNGSIIGYSKEFLDAHYEEIVEFAELQNFMEEKVKHFSSGMVSRLGFAIATAGDAAEILILDEVLSVGDEFFRKKSLKRIGELIHGGATVLMVSHGISTIIENCTKVVWIEKGIVKMIGDPQIVGEVYKNKMEYE